MSEYASPTTPGMTIAFRNYVIELVCLNMEPKLSPRFWKETRWAAKFKRECRGYAKFAKLYDDLETNPLRQRAVINAIKAARCQSLLRDDTLLKLDRRVQREYGALAEQRATLARQAVQPEMDATYMERNARFVGVQGKSKLGRIRKIEGEHGKGEGQGDGGQAGLD